MLNATIFQVRRAYESHFQLRALPTQTASEWLGALVKSLGKDEAYHLAENQSNNPDDPEPPVLSIYSRFGGEVSIIADAGDHKPRYLPLPGRLVQVLFHEDHEKRWVFAHPALRADDGILTIDKAIELAPKVTLSRSDLKKALKEAE
jgi:hypothetical protein